jgi:hypothetical protein
VFSVALFRKAPAAPWLAVLGVLAAPLASAAAPPDCRATARQVSKQVAAKPERVLLIVEDTLIVNDSCACEVVKAAIAAAEASPKLVGQIVLVAVKTAPAKAPQIAECAEAAAPKAATEINAALDKALGPDRPRPAPTPPPTPTEKPVPAPATPDPTNPPPTAPDATESTADFGLSPVTIGGVYLVYPGSGGSPELVEGRDGEMYFIGPQGQRIPLNPPPPARSQRPTRPPAIIIIAPPTPTTSDATPADSPIPTPLVSTP